MKKIFYHILAAAALLTGCNYEIIVQEGKGSLSLDLSCRTDYKDVVTKALQSDEEIINSLAVDITRTYDQKVFRYPAFSEIKGKVVELGSGSYIINASSPVKKDAAFDQPIFEGAKSFDIKTGEVTKVNLLCSISNVMVSVVLSDNFAKQLSSYTVTVSNGKGNLSWTKTGDGEGESIDDFEPAVRTDENDKPVTVWEGKKAGYFTVAPLTVTVDGYRDIDGTHAATTFSINSVNPADHHIVNLDAEVVGSAGIEINISNEVKPIDQFVIVPGFEEKPVPGDGPSTDEGEDSGDTGTETPPDIPETPSTAPTLDWPANPGFADMNLPMSMSAEVDVELVINAPKTIREFLIFVESGVLTPTIAALTAAGEDGIVNGVATMDMINDATLFGNLGETLPMGDAVNGKTSVNFSLSTLVPMINMYAGDITPGDRHTFTLKVTDAEGQVLEQPVTFVSVAAE